jgi:hypothetical protein
MGFEAITNAPDSAGRPQITWVGAAKALVAVSPPMAADPDLATIVKAWPALPEPIKAGIRAMVTAATCGSE